MSPNLPCEGIRKPEGPAFLTRLYPEMGGQVSQEGPAFLNRLYPEMGGQVSRNGSTMFNI